MQPNRGELARSLSLFTKKNEIMKYHVSETETLNKAVGVEAEIASPFIRP